eukprot:5975040-Pleurochrysis_carterae.AAC.2
MPEEVCGRNYLATARNKEFLCARRQVRPPEPGRPGRCGVQQGADAAQGRGEEIAIPIRRIDVAQHATYMY